MAVNPNNLSNNKSAQLLCLSLRYTMVKQDQDGGRGRPSFPAQTHRFQASAVVIRPKHHPDLSTFFHQGIRNSQSVPPADDEELTSWSEVTFHSYNCKPPTFIFT